MVCSRFQSEGMRLLDGELSSQEKKVYEEHVRDCDDCERELRDLGRVVELTNELRLRAPDEEFWRTYWSGIYRRLERGTGFLLVLVGAIAVLSFGIYKAVTSPDFLTFKGISTAVILLGFVVLFLSVLRERIHESKSDPYNEVQQ